MNERERLLLGAGDDEDAPFGFTDEMAMEWSLGPHPGYLSDFTSTARLHTTAGFVSLLAAALGAASAAAPPALHLRHHGTRVEGNVWPIIVGGSGTYKTTAALWAIDALEGFPDRRIPHPDSVQGLKEFYLWRHRGERDEASGEWFGGCSHPQGFLAYDEMMGFWEETAPRQRLAPLRPLITALYDNKGIEKLTRDRNNTFRVPYARLTMLGAVTPSTLEDYMTQNVWGNGFAVRFFWASAVPRSGVTLHNRPDEIDKARIAAATLELAQREVTPCAGLTPTARKLYEKYRLEVRTLMPQVHRKLHGLFGRYDVNTIRVALLHAYTTRRVDRPGWRLSAADIEWARRVVFASLVCARVLFRRLALTPYRKLRADLVHYLRASPRTRDELARLLLVKHRVLEEMIAGLVEEKRLFVEGTGGKALLHWIPLHQMHLTGGSTAAEVRRQAAATPETNNVISFPAPVPVAPSAPVEVESPSSPVEARLVQPTEAVLPSVFAEDL